MLLLIDLGIIIIKNSLISLHIFKRNSRKHRQQALPLEKSYSFASDWKYINKICVCMIIIMLFPDTEPCAPRTVVELNV